MTEMPADWKPLTGTFEIRFSEIDAWRGVSQGYEDLNGEWVELYSDEEYNQRLQEADGKTFLRVVMTDQRSANKMAMESDEFSPEDRDEAFSLFMESVGRALLQRMENPKPPLPNA